MLVKYLFAMDDSRGDPIYEELNGPDVYEDVTHEPSKRHADLENNDYDFDDFSDSDYEFDESVIVNQRNDARSNRILSNSIYLEPLEHAAPPAEAAKENTSIKATNSRHQLISPMAMRMRPIHGNAAIIPAKASPTGNGLADATSCTSILASLPFSKTILTTSVAKIREALSKLSHNSVPILSSTITSNVSEQDSPSLQTVSMAESDKKLQTSVGILPSAKPQVPPKPAHLASRLKQIPQIGAIHSSAETNRNQQSNAAECSSELATVPQLPKALKPTVTVHPNNTSATDAGAKLLSNSACRNRPWFHKELSPLNAEKLLRELNTNGAFLVREETGTFMLSLSFDGQIFHLPIARNNSRRFFLEMTRDVSQTTFATISELVNHFRDYELNLMSQSEKFDATKTKPAIVRLTQFPTV